LGSLRALGSLAVFTLLLTVPAGAAPGPFTLSGGPTCGSFIPAILFQWSTSSGATSYELRRDDGQNTVVSEWQPFDTNVVVGGPAHTYFVRASDGVATTDSNSVTVAPPPSPCSPPPESFPIYGKAFCDGGDPTHSMSPAAELDWEAVRYATAYDIYKNGVFIQSLNDDYSSYYYYYDFGTSTSDGSINTYYVVAKNAAGRSTSNTLQVTVPTDICVTMPPLPLLSGRAMCDAQNQPAVKLNWTVNLGDREWQVYRDGILYASLRSFTYLDTNVVPGHTYTYNVSTTALSAPLSNPITVAVSEEVCTPGPISFTSQVLCENDHSVVRLEWPASTNAASYSVTRDGTTIVSGLTSTSPVLVYTDVSAVPATTYSYRVIGINNSISTPSPTAEVTVTEACLPGFFIASATAICPHSAPAVLLTWSASAHASSYSVFRDDVQVGGDLPPTAREYTDEGISLGLHFYAVRASNATAARPSNTSVTLSKAPCGFLPDNFTASVLTTCIEGKPAVRINWSDASGASFYVISRNGLTLPGDYTFTPGVGFDASVTAGQTYAYAVIAENANGNTTAPAGTVTPSVGDCPPDGFTVAATTACNPPVTLTWTPSSNSVLNYSIYREQLLIGTVAARILTYADNATPPFDRSYSYFVRAIGTGGVTDSNVVNVNVDRSRCDLPAANLSAIDITPSTTSGRAGDTLDVSIQVANRGNATALPSMARVRLGRGESIADADAVLATIALPAMDRGAYIQRTMTVKLPALAAGTYYLFLSLDEEHVSGDGNFADDVKTSDAFNLIDMIAPKRRAATH
jgi:hypothetical protein